MENSTSPDLLHDLADEISYEHASKAMRLVNFIIDMIIVSIVNTVIGGMIQMMVLAAYISDMESNPSDIGITLGIIVTIYLVQFGLFLGYYTVCEKMMNGRTVGKLVTGTMALREDGAPLTWKNAILRSLCRIIPFEPIVAIFTNYPWHDDFTRTVVIKKSM
jgi:uncharacterized RDD family membrane protein YckC